MPIPVLMYHHVSPRKGDMVTVTPQVFEAQIAHLKDSGYRTLSLGELLDFIEGRKGFPGKSVALTFDDGWLDNFVYAWPVIRKYGVKAAFFVVTGWVDGASREENDMEDFRRNVPTHGEMKGFVEKGQFKKAVINWDMAREMERSGLVEFHSHTVTHRDCGRLAAGELQEELLGSRRRIGEELKRPCEFLCWPRGRYGEESVKAAQEAGFKALFTTEPGVVREGSDPYSIKRVVVKDGVRWFKTRLRIYTSPVMAGLYMKVK